MAKSPSTSPVQLPPGGVDSRPGLQARTCCQGLSSSEREKRLGPQARSSCSHRHSPCEKQDSPPPFSNSNFSSAFSLLSASTGPFSAPPSASVSSCSFLFTRSLTILTSAASPSPPL